MFGIDLHTHSTFSFDGHFSAEDMCLSAIEKNVGVLALTEHFDVMPGYQDAYYTFRAEERYNDISRLKEKYKDKLKLLNGIELGQPYTNPTACDALIKKYNFDFVLSGAHNLADGSDIYEIDYKTKPQCEEVMRLYLNEVIKTAQYHDYDSIAHIDFPLRKMENPYENDKSAYDLTLYRAEIEKILEIIVQKDKALELNTRGLICWHEHICPSDWVLKLFKEMGGKYITVGSDSHYSKYVGLGCHKAYEKLKRCGFDSVTYYENRQPVLLRI